MNRLQSAISSERHSEPIAGSGQERYFETTGPGAKHLENSFNKSNGCSDGARTAKQAQKLQRHRLYARALVC